MELKLTYYSKALLRNADVKICMPDNINISELNTVIVLHNINEKPQNPFDELTIKDYKLAVVLPDGGKSCWLNGKSIGQKYCEFAGNELIEFLKGISLGNPTKTCIMGYDVGGFGALKAAFTYPKNFSDVGAFYPAVFSTDKMESFSGIYRKIEKKYPVISEEIFEEFFGRRPINEFHKTSEFNISTIFEEMIKGNKKNCPKILFTCENKDTDNMSLYNNLFNNVSNKVDDDHRDYDPYKLTDDFEEYVQEIFNDDNKNKLLIENSMDEYEGYLCTLINDEKRRRRVANERRGICDILEVSDKTYRNIINKPTIKRILYVSAMLKLENEKIDKLVYLSNKKYMDIAKKNGDIAKKYADIAKKYIKPDSSRYDIVTAIEEEIGTCLINQPVQKGEQKNDS